MKPCSFILVATMFLTIVPAIAHGAVGVRQMEAPSSQRTTRLDVTAWYPAKAQGADTVLGESVFFHGTPALRDAPIESDRRLPVILLSHGAGLAGSPEALAWIAAPLAEAGFVVVAPRHPGNSGKDRSAAETMKIWLRPGDLSDALDALTREAFFRDHIDGEKVGVLGLSMGGGTALAIAGGRIDPERLAGYCDTDALNASLCEWVRQSRVDLRAMDIREADRDTHDIRISIALAIDPAPVDVFDFGSFSKIAIPVTVVNLGKPGRIPNRLDASKAAAGMRAATYLTIDDASHYSMFGECKPDAAEIAEAEKIGEPICKDGGGRPRGALHADMIGTAISTFRQALVKE